MSVVSSRCSECTLSSLSLVTFSGLTSIRGSPGALVVKNPSANARGSRDGSLIPEPGSFPGRGDGTPLQYSCMENSMGRGA